MPSPTRRRKDLGVAGVLDDSEEHLTRAGQVLGPLAYRAPEMQSGARGRAAGRPAAAGASWRSRAAPWAFASSWSRPADRVGPRTPIKMCAKRRCPERHVLAHIRTAVAIGHGHHL